MVHECVSYGIHWFYVVDQEMSFLQQKKTLDVEMG